MRPGRRTRPERLISRTRAGAGDVARPGKTDGAASTAPRDRPGTARRLSSRQNEIGVTGAGPRATSAVALPAGLAHAPPAPYRPPAPPSPRHGPEPCTSDRLRDAPGRLHRPLPHWPGRAKSTLVAPYHQREREARNSSSLAAMAARFAAFASASGDASRRASALRNASSASPGASARRATSERTM